MEYKKPNPRAVTSWRIGAVITLVFIAGITIPASVVLMLSSWDSVWKNLLIGAMALVLLYQILAVFILPKIEYRQWGYIIEEDKVVIRHGIFFVKKAVIPIIRIQNITISQGPINRKLGLYKVEMSLASGSFEIEGPDQETAEAISENLRARLYQRISEKGVL